jgi:diguanylate cyclase (GGDEF)-like protein
LSSPHSGPASSSADHEASAAESGGLPDAGEHGAAARTLQFLLAQGDAARADLAVLRRELTRARDELRSLRSAQLSEADEQLVQAAVHADTIAQSAVTSLDELTRHSQHDELTGAPNRTLMLDRLHNAIALARRRATRLAVLFVDLDDFKQINDTLGHAAGDQALQLVTQRLQAAVRDSDTVSRHSGDEFLVLLSDISNVADAASVATKILASLAVPAQLGANPLRLSASLGVAVYPDDGTDPATLITRADAAMYRSKRRGAGLYEFHGGAATTESEPGAGVAAPSGPPKVDAAFARHEARLQELSNANHELLRAAQIAQKLKTHAEEAHRRQINFVAKAAHAMRTPLSVIRMTVATLFDPAAEAQAASKQRDTLKRQTLHLTRLIDDLLDGSLVGGGEFKLDCCSVDIDTVVGNAVDASRPAIVLKRQRLHVQAPSRNVTLVCDPMRLAQVFSHLLNNASRRTPEGGDIWITAAPSEDDVVVTVADNGAGIAPDVLPRIFDLFVLDAQADDPGLGIGLAVAKELAKAHGGSVEASSAGKDQGSQFVVRIPLRHS